MQTTNARTTCSTAAQTAVASLSSRGSGKYRLSPAATVTGDEGAETAVAVLAHWRSAGHKVELDDFGTGFSSISLLQETGDGPDDGIAGELAIADCTEAALGRLMAGADARNETRAAA